MIEVCNEMKKLRQQLDERCTKWWDDSDEWICRTKFKVGYSAQLVSVVNGLGTYGGYSSVRPTNAGLLEMRINENDEPVGNLTADEVLTKVKEWLYDEERRMYSTQSQNDYEGVD